MSSTITLNPLSWFSKKEKKDFSALEHVPQMGDAILIHNSKNLISAGIELFEQGDVSHAALYVGGGNQGIIEYSTGGCQRNSLSKYYQDNIKIIVRRIRGLTVEQAEKMKEAAYRDLVKSRPYDYLSYVGFVWICIKSKLGIREAFKKDNPVQGAGKVCSTGYAFWAALAGLNLFPDIGEEAVTPQHILESSNLYTVIEM